MEDFVIWVALRCVTNSTSVIVFRKLLCSGKSSADLSRGECQWGKKSISETFEDTKLVTCAGITFVKLKHYDFGGERINKKQKMQNLLSDAPEYHTRMRAVSERYLSESSVCWHNEKLSSSSFSFIFRPDHLFTDHMLSSSHTCAQVGSKYTQKI